MTRGNSRTTRNKGKRRPSRVSLATELTEFAKELAMHEHLPMTQDSLNELLQRGCELASARMPGFGIGIVVREAGEARWQYTTHKAIRAPSLEVPSSIWNRLMASRHEFVDISLPSKSVPKEKQMVRAIAWGDPEKISGALFLYGGPGVRKWDGASPWIDVLAAHFHSVARMGEGLSELNRTRERLEGEFSTLHMVASTITAHPDKPGDMLGAIVAIVAKALKADLCAFLLYDESAGELITQPGGYGITGDEGSLYRMSLTNDKSSSVRVFLTGQPFITGDAQNDPLVIADYAKKWKCHSLVVVPLTLESRRVGVMRVGSFQKNFFTKDHIRLVELIAEEAVVLVETAILTRKLSEANQRLSEINRIKDDFVSTVSHEFKTPLTAIKGFLSVMMEGETGSISPQQKQFLAIAIGATDRLTALVADLLDLSKLEGGIRMDFMEVEMPQLLEQCVDDYQPQARQAAIELKYHAPTRLVPVKGDPKWLRQVLDNLVSNALKFTSSGGTVLLRAVHQGEMVRISVEDTGVGISPEDHKKVFEKFYRVNRKDAVTPPGTGLGLAIAKYIVDKHDGKIWLESEAGKGATFYFILPIFKPKAEVIYLDKKPGTRARAAG